MTGNCLSRHHRKPKCQGGSNKKYNISLVRRIDHQEWHVLCNGNLSPEMIALKFNRPERFRTREILAWHMLFGTKEPEVVAQYVSLIWIDPAYEFIYKYNSFVALRRN